MILIAIIAVCLVVTLVTWKVSKKDKLGMRSEAADTAMIIATSAGAVAIIVLFVISLGHVSLSHHKERLREFEVIHRDVKDEYMKAEALINAKAQKETIENYEQNRFYFTVQGTYDRVMYGK